jgi:hypothetical protein
VPTSSFGPSLRIPSTSLPIEPPAVPQFQPYKMVVYYQIAGKKVGSHVVSLHYPEKAAARSLSLSPRASFGYL